MTLRLNGSTSGYTEIDAPAVAGSNTLRLPTGNGVGGNVLATDGSGNLSWVDGRRMVLETAKPASGSSVDFTGIPSWAKRITVVLDNVSVTGTDNILIQLGDSGGVETTGYISTTVYTTYVTSPPSIGGSGFSSTAGIIVTGGAPQNWPTGSIQFDNISGNRWIASGVYNFANLTTTVGYSAGEKTLSATLDRVRITVTGADTFDNGAVNIIYEG